jgi:hypothetical protein
MIFHRQEYQVATRNNPLQGLKNVMLAYLSSKYLTCQLLIISTPRTPRLVRNIKKALSAKNEISIIYILEPVSEHGSFVAS